MVSNYPDDIGLYTNDPRHPDYDEPECEDHPEAELERQLERMRDD